MKAEITTKRIGGIWHGYLTGHPGIDERALTEEIAKRKVHELAKKRGLTCGSETKLFGGKTCELEIGHDWWKEVIEHRQGNFRWFKVPESRA